VRQRFAPRTHQNALRDLQISPDAKRHVRRNNIDLIDHDAWNLYQIAKVYLAEYDKLA
jgi:hypothetical protein